MVTYCYVLSRIVSAYSDCIGVPRCWYRYGMLTPAQRDEILIRLQADVDDIRRHVGLSAPHGKARWRWHVGELARVAGVAVVTYLVTWLGG